VAGQQQGVKLVHITTVPESLFFLSGQVRWMKEKGLEVHAISSPGEMLDQFGEQEEIATHAVEMARRIDIRGDLKALAKMCRCLRNIHPQIVHAHTPKGGLLGTMAARITGVPVRIYHIHGLPFMTATGAKKTILQWTEKVSCGFAGQVLCVSPSIREVVVKNGLCPELKVKVIKDGSINGVDATLKLNPRNINASERLRSRHKHGIPPDSLVIGFVGRVIRDKGIAELAQAWSELRDEYPNLHALIVGPFEPQDPAPPDAEAILRSDPRIHLTGMDWNIPPLYAAMDIVVLPTYREGFPGVPLEAGAMELPVVATDVPGCVDAIIDGETGILIPPRDSKALAVALHTYLNDADLMRRHGAAGRERALRDFAPEGIWEATYGEYCRMLSEVGLHVDKTPV